MIYLKQIKKTFPNVFRPIINGLDLSIKKGEFTVLIGSNGCGKSTLLKLISGEYFPDSGLVQRNGKVAQVVQDVNLGTVAELSLLENIALTESSKPSFRFYHRFKSNIIQKLQHFGNGLEQFIDLPLAHLSGGQKQMIATLMAIHSGCDILLLDEHTSALDPKMQADLMNYTTGQIKQKKLTTVMITHNLEDAIHYGDRLVMLHQGNIVLDVSAEQKRKLQVNDLMPLFHHYEDKILMSGGAYDC